MKLNRADVEWLLATHENGHGPVIWADEQQRSRTGLNLCGADLRGSKECPVSLKGLPLSNLCGGYSGDEELVTTWELQSLGCTHLEGAGLEGAGLEKTDLTGAFLERANLREADLRRAYLSEVHLAGADLMGANLEGCRLSEIDLAGAWLYAANLMGADLSKADLSRADLTHANLSKARLKGANLTRAGLKRGDLSGIILAEKDHIGPLLADVRWGEANLNVVDWSQIIILGEERQAQLKQNEEPTVIGIMTSRKSPGQRLREHQMLAPSYNWLILVFGEPLKTRDLSAMLLPKISQEVAQNADHAPVSLTGRTGNDLDQRHSRGTTRECDLVPRQFALPAVCDTFICHS